MFRSGIVNIYCICSLLRLFFDFFFLRDFFQTSSNVIVELKNLSRKSNVVLRTNVIILSYYSKLKFNSILDLVGLDTLSLNVYFNKVNSLFDRFFIFYIFLSFIHKQKLVIKFSWSFFKQIISLGILFSGIFWLEREVFDLFGILFNYHPDLRRILTDYGFDGFPNQKNFNVFGYKELVFNEEVSGVVYEKVSLSQNFRYFSNKNTWGFNLKGSIVDFTLLFSGFFNKSLYNKKNLINN